MNDELKQYIKLLIEKSNNLKNLQNYGINIENINGIETITITFKEKYIDDILSIVSDIKYIYTQIQKFKPCFTTFVFKDYDVEIFNKPIDLPFYMRFENSTINININNDKHKIEKVHLKTMNFYNCHFKDISILLDFNSVNINDLYIDINGQKIDMLQIQHLSIKESKNNKFLIKNCEINRLMFWKLESDIDIVLENINKKFDEKQEQLKLMKCTFNNRFILKDSFFHSKFELESVSFNGDTSFKGLYIKEIDLDTTFFNSDKSVDFSMLKILDNKDMSRSTARKIKHILEKDSNKIESNYFHSYEMMAKQKELYNQENTSENINDKIIFGLNKEVSNHGLNWNLPIFWMIFIGLYYSGFLYSKALNTDTIILFVSFLGISIFFLKVLKFDDIGRYILALIPAVLFYLFLYSTNEFDLEYLTKFLSIIDFTIDDNISLTERSFSKLIMGYLIYHFIVAVRKDTRK